MSSTCERVQSGWSDSDRHPRSSNYPTVADNILAVIDNVMAQAPLTLDDLDAHLFKCADIIRNTVDKTDYMDYILPLVFYKTLSDTYQDM